MTPAEVTPVPRGARQYQGLPAGVVSRSVSGAIDTVVVVVVVVGGYAAINGVLLLIDPRGFEPAQLRPFLSITTTLIVLVLYLTAAWSLASRTYGGHVMGLRVINGRGGRPGVLRAFARAVVYVLFPLGLLWSAVSPGKLSLQDLLFGTSVIYDWRPTTRSELRGAITRGG